MAIPEHLVVVRHGQSEANIVQKRFKHDPAAIAPAGFFDRHDSRMRLSATGRDQARAAGDWLRRNRLATFDRFYVSPHARTAETDWGEFGVLNAAERADRFALSQKLKDQHKCRAYRHDVMAPL
jgi:phosphohistidine phosphatase SixA